jgi:hypothetical protein
MAGDPRKLKWWEGARAASAPDQASAETLYRINNTLTKILETLERIEKQGDPER